MERLVMCSVSQKQEGTIAATKEVKCALQTGKALTVMNVP